MAIPVQSNEGPSAAAGEAGPETTRIPLEPADALVARMVEAVVTDLPFASGDRVLLMGAGSGLNACCTEVVW